MTRPDPLAEALARLREEVTAAEIHLATVSESGSFAEALAAASLVTTRRRALVETASGRRSDALARHAGAHDAGASALADALAGLPEPDPSTTVEPEPGEDPLAAALRSL